MYWDDDEDEDFPTDEGEWRSWAITFYGHIPKYDKESEGGLALRSDAVITHLEWRFPRVMLKGWVGVVYANESAIQEIDLSEDVLGSIAFNERFVLLKGSTVSARIFYVNGGDDFVPLEEVNKSYGQGYSITVNGIQQNDADLLLDESMRGIESNDNFTQWQLDLS